MSPPFIPSYCKGSVRALEVCRMFPFFLLVGFGEHLDDRGLSYVVSLRPFVL